MTAQTNSVDSTVKSYRVKSHGGGECDNTPSLAIFEIDVSAAREILCLAALVKANDLQRVEKYDCRAEFLQYDPVASPEDAWEAGEDNSVRTECDVLVVTQDSFWFSAYIKHTDARVSCESQTFDELAAHFGLAAAGAV